MLELWNYERLLRNIVSETAFDLIRFSLHPFSVARIGLSFSLVLLHAAAIWTAAAIIRLPSLIRRGAVVAAQALVIKDVGELEVVGGNPAKVFSKRNPDALGYSAKYRPLFY